MAESFKSVRRPHGSWLDEDGNEYADTLQCCHCNSQFTVVKGSGKVRGFCTMCMGPTCGAQCHECLPFMKRLEEFEKGKRATLL